MARLKFRTTTITLDTDEEVSGVTAVVDAGAHQVITNILGTVETTDTRHGGTEMTIQIGRQQILELLTEAGKHTGLDPDHESTYDIYNSLSAVVYRLIEDE